MGSIKASGAYTVRRDTSRDSEYKKLYSGLGSGADGKLYTDIKKLMDEKKPVRQKDAINGLVYSLAGRSDAEELLKLLRRLQGLK